MKLGLLAEPRGNPCRRRIADLVPEHEWGVLQEHFGLSTRQRQVTQLVCRALENKAIAAELGVTVDTVRMHLKEVFRKAHVDSRVELVVQVVSAERALCAAAGPRPAPG